MARKKTHGDDEVLALLYSYWETDCKMVPKKLTYPGFAKYLNEHGIQYDSNVLKHREAVVEEVRRLKTGGGHMKPAKVSAVGTPEAKALQKKYKELLKLVSDSFTESACASIMKRMGLPAQETAMLKPEAAEMAVIRMDERPFENPFVRKMAELANSDEEKEEQEDGSRTQ